MALRLKESEMQDLTVRLLFLKKKSVQNAREKC